jgi:asparagine synthase (glutamine-hydrolysing)
MERLYSAEMKRSLPHRNAYYLFAEEQPWQGVPLLITQRIFDTWLLGNCISLGDRLSMASSVELRLPLLDYRLVEVVFGLRKCASDHELPPKVWLKSALADLLPQELINRPKRGFTPPILEWVTSLMSSYRNRVEHGSLIQSGYLNHQAVKQLLDSIGSSTWNWVSIYKLLVFEMWYEQIKSG